MTRLCYLLLPFLCWLLPTTVASQRRPAAARPTPFVLGVVEELYSAQLAENRKLNIYLPAGYQPGDTARYPVIYLLDGSADEDFIHVVGLVQFNTFPWVRAMPQSIVVGIANVNRQHDFTYPTTQAAGQETRTQWRTVGQVHGFSGAGAATLRRAPLPNNDN